MQDPKEVYLTHRALATAPAPTALEIMKNRKETAILYKTSFDGQVRPWAVLPSPVPKPVSTIDAVAVETVQERLNNYE